MSNEQEQSKDDSAIRALKEVHQKIKDEPNLQYKPDDDMPTSNEMAEQIKGSDADEDQNFSATADDSVDVKKEEVEKSDADSDKENNG